MKLNVFNIDSYAFFFRSTSTSTNLANHISTFCSSENFTQSLAFLDQVSSFYSMYNEAILVITFS